MGRVVRSLKHGWNAFRDSPTPGYTNLPAPRSARRTNAQNVRYYSDKSIIAQIYTRLAVDLAMVEFYHAKLDENDVATEVVRDALNDCLTLDPNIDQTAMIFKIDIALTMFETGQAVIVPIDTTINPAISSSYIINSMRVGRLVGESARHVVVEAYDDREVDADGNMVNGGVVKQVTFRKEDVAIVDNPFYGIMNEPSGTLQRLLRKLAILDAIDEAAGSGKLDILIQMPYVVRGDVRREQAKQRREDIRNQLRDDELGIGYIDASEKVIQLNRPIENKLLSQIEYLYNQLYAQLGVTPEIMNGTANRDTINNYYDRTIEPVANAIALEIKRKFLTKTARTQRHSIEVYRDPLKLIPISELAEVADKLIRNAVLTANEFRPKIGYRPSTQPGANLLMNPNMPVDDQAAPVKEEVKETNDEPTPEADEVGAE